ncbi:MAG: hypothetical protein GXP62_14305 [Oligoflexia bacterium]|nr:hypothetical protein [Oligoflexia bacterium]
MLLLALCISTASAGTIAQAEASLGLGWVEYAALWTGDPILGGFDLYSPPQPLDRLLISPSAMITLRPSDSQRIRIRASGRTLSRLTTIDSNGDIQYLWASDGVPLAQAAAERLFLDEASWRWRPGGDRWLDLRLGILPWSLAGGRMLAESWPGATLRLDAARKGWAPVAVEAHASVTPTGSNTVAMAVRYEPSWLEYVGLEAAYSQDPRQGIAPLVQDDLGMLVELWRGTSGEFIDKNQDWVLSGLYDLYGQEVDGVRAFHEDLKTFVDLDGTARVLHLAASGRVMLGRTLIDAALVHARGQVALSGNGIPGELAPADIDGTSWATQTPTTPFDLRFPVSGWAWDLDLEFLLASHWRISAFFQGMTGEDELLSKALAGETVHVFLATDLAFVRTRVFPWDAALQSGAWSFPPGVAGYGLMTPGTSIDLATDHTSASFQLALPMATEPSPLEPHGQIYGLEADLFLGARAGKHTTLAADFGAFQSGTFFVDQGGRDTLAELPIGWRLHGSITIQAGGPK